MRGFIVLAVVAIAALAAAGPANAAVQENDTIPLNDFQVFIPCADGGAGDTVTLNGQLHVLITFTINGHHASGTSHFQPVGLRGTDTEGHAYKGVGITRSTFSGSLVNGHYTETDINNFYIVGIGRAPSYRAHETLHFTVNAHGTVTAAQDHLRITCS